LICFETTSDLIT